ncbi:MAG: hypothetical protein ABJQ21_20135 [Roseibium sp.]
MLNGYTESRAGAQNTSGSPLSTASTPSGSPSEPEVPGGGGGGGGAPTPDAAALTGTTLVLAADTTLTLAGTSAIVAGPGVTTIVVELAGIESINLNGYKLQMSGETLDAIANAKGGAMIAIDGIASGGGALDITGVDFGNIAEGPLEAPNVAVFDFKGLTPEELVPENFTVNGSYGDAIKAFWVALDAGYYKALPLSNDEVNTNFFRLGNEYVDFLKGGNVALLDIGQTKVNLTPDYTDRQQTVHDNILGNLTDGSVAWRVGQGATDVRSDLTKIFENRPIPSGHDNSLEKFQEAKEWDAIIGVTRTDADIEIEIGKLSDIASDPLGGMWNGNPGHSNDHFRVVRNTDAEIELAIKAKIRADGDYGDSNRTDLLGESFYDNISPEGAVGLPPAWNVPGGEAPGRESESTARWSFDFSIATNIDTGNLKTPELADYQFKLVFDVDPTAGTSFVTLALDRTDGSDWLFESAENADVAAAMQQLLSGDLSNPYIGDNVGENDSSNPTYVSQNSQNYGFANGNEHLVNAFIGNAYNGDGTKIDSVNYWEAETHPGNFKIGLEAFTSNGSELLADSYINVGQELLIDLANGAGAGAAWQTDRRAVDSISTVANPEDNTDDVIAINIAESSETSGFHRFQGAKLKSDDGTHYIDAGKGASFSTDLYIDPTWATDGFKQETGVWIQMQDHAKSIGGGGRFSIAEYLDASAVAEIDPAFDLDGAAGALRFWNSTDGWDHYLAVDQTGWVNLTFEFEENNHSWYLNGSKVYDTTQHASEVDILETVIFNSVNYGEDETYLYDNVQISGVSTDSFYYETIA